MGEPELPQPSTDSANDADRNDEELPDDSPSCRTCGYNLKGLPSDGCCPECGRPIRESSDGADLNYADRRWLRMVGWGLIALAVLICLPFLRSTIYSAIPFFQGSPIDGNSFGLLVYPAFDWAMRLLHLAAAVLLTWPRAKRKSDHGTEYLRWFIIGLAVAHIISSKLSSSYYSADYTPTQIISVATVAVGLFCQLLYVRRILVLLKRPWMAALTIVIAAMGLAATLRHAIVEQVSAGERVTFHFGPLDILADVGAYTIIVILIMATGICGHLRRSLGDTHWQPRDEGDLLKHVDPMRSGIVWLQLAFLVYAAALGQYYLGPHAEPNTLFQGLVLFVGIALPALMGGRRLIDRGPGSDDQHPTKRFAIFRPWLVISLFVFCLGEYAGHQWTFLGHRSNLSIGILGTSFAFIVFWLYLERIATALGINHLRPQLLALGIAVSILAVGFLLSDWLYTGKRLERINWLIYQFLKMGLITLCLWTVVLLGTLARTLKGK